MDRFFPVKKAVETVTAPDLVVAILFFRCADIFSGKKLILVVSHPSTKWA